MQISLELADLDPSLPALTVTVIDAAAAPSAPQGLTIVGDILSFGPAGLKLPRPVQLQLKALFSRLLQGGRRVQDTGMQPRRDPLLAVGAKVERLPQGCEYRG